MKGPSKSYCTLVDEQIAKEYEAEKAAPPSFPLRPSAAGECGRKLALDLMAYNGDIKKKSEDRKPHIMRLLSLGHHVETHALEFLKKIPGFKVQFQQQVVDVLTLASGRTIAGAVDAVMWSEEHKALLDVKSVGDRFDQSFNSKWDMMMRQYDRMATMQRFDENAWYVEDPVAFIEEIGEDPLVKNMVQINLYASSEFFQKRGIDHAVIYRYCKNNSKHMEIRFKPSPRLIAKTKDKFDRAEKAAAAKNPELMRKDYALGSTACAYCPYQADCWPGASKKEIYAGAPKKYWAAKIHELEKGKDLAELFAVYEQAEPIVSTRKAMEAKIIVEMEAHGCTKVKLDNGNVYETKQLSKEIVLRKGKE